MNTTTPQIQFGRALAIALATVFSLCGAHAEPVKAQPSTPVPGQAEPKKDKPAPKPKATPEPEQPVVAANISIPSFNQGVLDSLINKEAPPKQAKQLKLMGNSLFLEGDFHTRVFASNDRLRDFVLETRIDKKDGAYAGVVVRDNVTVYFQMKNKLCIGGSNSPVSFSTQESFKMPADLKIVCAGPAMRVYVNGKHITTQRIEPETGRVGFYAHKGSASYESFSADGKVSPEQGILVEAKPEGGVLVFDPAKNVQLPVEVGNYAGQPQEIEVSATAQDWDGKALGQTVKKKMSLAAGKHESALMDLGKVPAGFQKAQIVAKTASGAEVANIDDLPLAVQESGKAVFSAPAIPVAAYGEYTGNKDPVYLLTYAHATARILADSHFNAIVADGSFTSAALIDIYKSYGIATIMRGGKFMENPAVIGTLVSDEPKPDEIAKLKEEYQKVAESSGKQVTTCFIGEAMGLGNDGDPVLGWAALEPKLRAFRWYGVKKSFYNQLFNLKYRGWLPLASVVRITEASSDIPWWFIPQSFGKDDSQDYYKNPTAGEMRAMMHLGMAHGANGMLNWCLQNWLQSKSEWQALIQQKSLQPTDKKMGAAAEVAGLIDQNKDLLSRLRYGSFEVVASDPIRVEAVPRRTEANEGYIYAVNLDSAAPVTVTLTFPSKSAEVKDLFSGKSVKTTEAGSGLRAAELTITPGAAALLEVGPVAPMEKTQIAELSGPTLPSASLVAKVGGLTKADGVAVVAGDISKDSTIAGDAIGLSRADDPRKIWKKAPAGQPRILNWTGLLDARTKEGYLPLYSALVVAGADPAESPWWTLYPGTTPQNVTPAQLRAMIHLALASGSKAVVVPEKLDASLSGVVAEFDKIAKAHGKTIASLSHSEFGVICRNPNIAAIPRDDQPDPKKDGKRYLYVVNLDTKNSSVADLQLWAGAWTWTKATDLFSGKDLPVKQSVGLDYISTQLTLGPGEAALIETDAVVLPMKERKAREQALLSAAKDAASKAPAKAANTGATYEEAPKPQDTD